MLNLLDLDRGGLSSYLESLGESSFRAKQLFQWIHQRGVCDFDLMTDVSKALRKRLSERSVIKVPQSSHLHASADGTLKWLLPVDGSNSVEAVFIPETERGTLCVSSQAGCALECAFCATGREGFNRNLSVSEIIGQLWLAQHRFPTDGSNQRRIGTGVGAPNPVSNVVMMGMGEPLTNYDHVVSSLKIMLDDCAYGLSRRRVTLSTSGIVPGIHRLREDCPVSLAVSLHAPNDELRDQLVPINKKYPIAELMEACVRYTDSSVGSEISGVKWQRKGAPRDFVTFEYVMLRGVNDSIDCAKQLIDITRGVSCKFNLIPFNAFDESGFERSEDRVVSEFQRHLIKAGQVATVRKTRGDDIAGACGQLAGEIKNRRSSRRVDNRASSLTFK